ncbi:MAG: TetR/AcrR family transcriptional regulator [Rhodospirillaceae bacterium]|nr:TetR/AcrR family transcriptional regulator [Rhodospirillaceae bacterium]
MPKALKTRAKSAAQTADAASPRKVGKGRLKRQAKEAAIVAAFDRVVRRDGLRNVGVNALVKEAGVGKGLIYEYFGGLSGVVKVWGERHKLWPSTAELMGLTDDAYAHLHDQGKLHVHLEKDCPCEKFSGMNPRDRIRTVVRNHMQGLRNNPVSSEVLADELMAPTEITQALQVARRRLGEEHAAIHAHNDSMRDYDNRSLVMILLAASNYFAMRALRAPRFMGEAIDTPEGWEALLKRFDRVVDIVFDKKGADEKNVADHAIGTSVSLKPLQS